jgi:hypothetical protein
VTVSSQVVPTPFPVPSSMARWHMRIAQARQIFDDDIVAGHRYVAASKRPNFRQHLERRSESGDLGENLLGSADHLPVLDVVCGLLPRADQSPVLDRSARQVCAQMSTPPRLSGSRRESHPPAPTDPGVTISRHRALVILAIRIRARMRSLTASACPPNSSRKNTLPVDRTNTPQMTRPLGSTPTAPSRGFTATTSRSASASRNGTHCLAVQPLDRLPLALRH